MTGFAPMVRRECEVDGCSRSSVCRKMCRYHYERWRRTADRSEIGRWKDPEVRFDKSTRWGQPSDHRPELGPCLLFIGADNGNGYGQFRHNDKNGYAHRYAWERAHGTIPDGLTVDHLCRVRRCVNVEHMELTDRVDNYMRGVATRTACPKGHDYAPENLYVDPRRPGVRICMKCRKNSSKASDARRANARRGLPDSRVMYSQSYVREVIAQIRAAEMTVAVGARRIGCNPGYLGRRIWRETKTDVIRRDGACVMCGRSDVTLDAHHRIARGSGGAARPEISFGMANLVTLCRSDHQFVEQNPNEARELGLRLDRGQIPDQEPVVINGTWVKLDNVGDLRPMEGITHG